MHLILAVALLGIIWLCPGLFRFMVGIAVILAILFGVVVIAALNDNHQTQPASYHKAY